MWRPDPGSPFQRGVKTFELPSQDPSHADGLASGVVLGSGVLPFKLPVDPVPSPAGHSPRRAVADSVALATSDFVSAEIAN